MTCRVPEPRPADSVTPNVRLYEDLRALLDHMDSEYVNADMSRILRRLRQMVGR